MVNARRKGKVGEAEFTGLLAARGYSEVQPLGPGRSQCDVTAVDSNGAKWAIEIKHRKSINLTYYLIQARENARKAKGKWMLAIRLHGYRSWMVLRQGMDPDMWHEGDEEIGHE